MQYYPLVILAIGVVTVIGMIIFLRVNAFIALITAAIVVSLMAPGPIAERISRVAEGFGSTAAKIGIVIAMAALIGKCLMDSGAADRIVRSFLRVLGEKRASTALMGSGFVLAIPVFFDTVFYLLVPLARSLWRRTRKNYMLYILAIGCGGAITHSLVPPTPGPLMMAANLNIDLGWMIMIGTLVALPTAVVGLWVCRLMNRQMDIPMRPYAHEVEQKPLPDDELPGLWISLAPVILPVILISANTIATTIADAEHTPRFRNGDVADWAALSTTLGKEATDGETTPAARVRGFLPKETRTAIDEAVASGQFDDPDYQAKVRKALNGLLAKKELYDEKAFLCVLFSESTKKLLTKKDEPKQLSPVDLERFNRLLLEDAFENVINKHQWETPRRQVANVTSLLGDPNLALLLSAAIAMWVLAVKRRLSLRELGVTAEDALMSGGIIILITAGGGAFGAMLKQANIGETIQQMVGGSEMQAGWVMLAVAFGVASMMKIAQGSGTVSMITASAMMAAMVTPDQLPYHPVYLATAIGSGSLVASWMNDSGFWIVSRMSGLTEVETLKSWTVLLVILGFIGLGFTLLFATVLPLT